MKPALKRLFAIAETRSDTTFDLLQQTYKNTRHTEYKDSLLSAIALTRQDKAIDFLFDLFADGNRSAREALETRRRHPPLERLRKLPR